jgi:hypothetical protein
MASKANLDIYEGDDYLAQVKVSNGLPPDQVLTGYTAKAQIRAGPADTNTTILAEFVTSIASPYITLSLDHTQTAALGGQLYDLARWDLQLTDSSGTITTILAGDVHITPDITR